MTNGVWTDPGMELDSSHRLTPVTRLHAGDAQASAELSLAVESYGARHGIELLERIGAGCVLWLRRGGRLILSRQVGAVADVVAVEQLLERPLADVFSDARRLGGAVEVPGRLVDGSPWRVRIVALPEGAMAAIWMEPQAGEGTGAEAGTGTVDLAMPRRLMALASRVGGLSDGKASLRERAHGLQRALDREAWKLLGQRGEGLPVDLRAVPLTAKLEGIQARINTLIPDTIQSEWDVPPGLAQVAVPAPAIRYIVDALTRNAVQAMTESGGRLRLRGGVLDLDGGTTWHGHVLAAGTYVFVEVTDSGCGMPIERADELARGEVLGSIQAICGLARGWGGGLRIRSSPGRGTIVQVVFPAHGIESRNKPARRAIASSLRTVLVVMPAGPACAKVVSGLETLGLNVVTADSIARATDCFREWSSEGGVTLILLTEQLSDGAGFGLVRRLREMAPTLPVVLMTDSPVDEVESDLPDLAPGRVVPLQYAARMAVGAANMLLPRA